MLIAVLSMGSGDISPFNTLKSSYLASMLSTERTRNTGLEGGSPGMTASVARLILGTV